MTLQRYLTRLIWLCILPVLVLAVGMGSVQFEQAREAERGRAQRLAQLLATDIDQALEARLAGLHMLSHTPTLEQPAPGEELYHAALSFRDAFGGEVLLVDAQSNVLLHTGQPPGSRLPALPRPAGRSALPIAYGSGQPAVGDPFIGPVGDEPVVAIAMPVTTAAHGTMLFVNLVPLRQLGTLVDGLQLPPLWQAAVHDTLGAVMLSRGFEAGPAATPAAGTLRFAQTPKHVPWRVEIHVPSATYAQELASVGGVIALALLATTALSVVVGRWGTRRLGRAVRSLVDLGPPLARPAADIQEIGHARRLLDQALRERESATQALRLRDEQLRRIFESTHEVIIATNEQQVIVMANPAAGRVFGRPLEQLVGSPLSTLMPERFRALHHQHMRAFGLNGPGPRTMGPQRPEVVGLRADGQEFPIEASVSHALVGDDHLYTVILRDVTERRRLEQALQASHADLARLVIAQQTMGEDERKRIARELHDELQQVLAAIKMDAGALEQGLGGDPGRLAPLIARIDRLAGAAISSSRRIVNDLRPQLLEDLGLVPALEVLARRFAERTGIAVTVDTDERCREDGAVPDPIALCLYRAAQEGLNNVAKHAQARQVRLDVRARPQGGWLMRLRDDGRGLQPGDRSKPDSFGLRGMAERVQALGGRLSLEEGEGPGLTLVVEIEAQPREALVAPV